LPLFESGTLGLKSNVQPVIPGVTESYNDEPEQSEESIALCTLKQYPNKIEHTIQWARDIFEKEFAQDATRLGEYLDNDPRYFENLKENNPGDFVSMLGAVVSTVEARPTSFADCVRLARKRFEDNFVNNIKQLLYQYVHCSNAVGCG
jgi:ubiquitin-activating enzyme E1